jgi:hypothetical protein
MGVNLMQNYAFKNVVGFGSDGRVFNLDSEINADVRDATLFIQGRWPLGARDFAARRMNGLI